MKTNEQAQHTTDKMSRKPTSDGGSLGPDGLGDNMKTSHTPGPWDVTEGEADMLIREGARHTCRRNIYYIESDGGRNCIGVYDPESMNAMTGEANARLIAAAPELLECLEAIEESGGLKDPHLVKCVRAAIAKAQEAE